MDGVIIDSELIHVMAENYVLNKYGIFPTEADWQSFKGKTSLGIFSQMITEHDLCDVSAEYMTEEKIDKFLEMILVADINLYGGFIGLVNDLGAKYDIALATSSHSRIQNAIFDRFDLHKHFSTIVTGDMVTKGKPDPEPYILAAGKMGLPIGACTVIEDSINGILSAKVAGANVIAVTHTFPREQLFQADHIVDSLRAIQDIL